MSRIPLKAVLRELNRRGNVQFANKDVLPETQSRVNELITGMMREWSPTWQTFNKLDRALWEPIMRMKQDSPIQVNTKEGKLLTKLINRIKDDLTGVYTVLKDVERKYKK